MGFWCLKHERKHKDGASYIILFTKQIHKASGKKWLLIVLLRQKVNNNLISRICKMHLNASRFGQLFVIDNAI